MNFVPFAVVFIICAVAVFGLLFIGLRQIFFKR
jgi:hypothetical protein